MASPQGTLTGGEASVPAPLCTDRTLRLRKGKGPARQSLHSQVQELYVTSTVRSSPSLLHQKRPEGRRRTLHLPQVFTGHISVLSAEMGGCQGLGTSFIPWPPFCRQCGWARLVEEGLPETPPPPITRLWWELGALTFPPFLPPLVQPACMVGRHTPMGRCGTQPSVPSDPCPASCAPVRTAARTASG